MFKNFFLQIGSLDEFYLFEHQHVHKRSAQVDEKYHSRLKSDPQVRKTKIEVVSFTYIVKHITDMVFLLVFFLDSGNRVWLLYTYCKVTNNIRKTIRVYFFFTVRLLNILISRMTKINCFRINFQVAVTYGWFSVFFFFFHNSILNLFSYSTCFFFSFKYKNKNRPP